jgi:hypothetical protein
MTKLANMTDEDKYQHQLRLNRERQRKYYEANKDKILGKKKTQREATCTQCKTVAEPELPQNTNIIQKFKTKLEQIGENTGDSIPTFLRNLSSFIKFTSCDDLSKCLKKPKNVLNLLDNARMGKNGTGNLYAVNSKKSYIDSVLKAIDTLGIKVDKKPYTEYKARLGIMSSDEHAVKKATEKVEDINTYLTNVETKFGKSSKEYVLSRLYDEAPLRDDFHQLIIIQTENKADDKNKNYIKIPRAGLGRVIANDYKTAKKFGTIKIDLTIGLTNLIRQYMKDNDIGYGQGLFGDKKRLSAFVSTMNKSMGYKGGISLFRKMKISTLLDGERITDAKLRQDLSNKMGHAPATQLQYLRNLIQN